MALTVTLEEGRAACAETIRGFVRAADGLTEHELLDVSRCHGWSRLDAVTHVISGWQEMLGGLVSVVDAEPTVDAATYWSAFADAYGGEDSVSLLMAQRRRTSTYSRPESTREHLRELAAALVRGVDAFGDQRCLWQKHVFAPGDFLAVWAVENVVHHLDLRSVEPAPANALALARATVEALAGTPLPSSWTDEDATLIGTGRRPVPDGVGELAGRLPVLG